MPPSNAMTPAFLDKILTLMAPLFVTATGGDVEAARETVRATLASYQARNDNELRLAALVVMFGFGVLDALSKAADPALSLDQVMDLRDNATALSQAGDRAQTALDALRRRRLAESAAGPRLNALPSSVGPDDLLAFVRSEPVVRGIGTQSRTGGTGDPRPGSQPRRGAAGGGRTTMH
jgi:hypothetical protein